MTLRNIGTLVMMLVVALRAERPAPAAQECEASEAAAEACQPRGSGEHLLLQRRSSVSLTLADGGPRGDGGDGRKPAPQDGDDDEDDDDDGNSRGNGGQRGGKGGKGSQGGDSEGRRRRCTTTPVPASTTASTTPSYATAASMTMASTTPSYTTPASTTTAATTTAPTTPAARIMPTTPAPVTTPTPTTTSAGPCHSLLEGEDCYSDVLWAMNHGIVTNPELYPAPLSAASGWEDFQAHLHTLYPDRCPQPCPKAPRPTGELCVASAVKLDFFHSVLAHSNLGGLGPDAGEENMRYGHVGNRTSFTGDGEVVRSFDLVVTAAAGYRSRMAQQRNGLSGSYGIVNLDAPSSASLTFHFEDSETRERVTLERFHFSILDIDQSRNSQESMLVGGFESFAADPQTEVGHEEGPDGKTRFFSTRIGKGCDNPKDPMELREVTCGGNTVDQKKRVVTFVFANTSSFDVALEAACSRRKCGGRNFLFAGSTSLSYTCEESVLPGLCATFGDPHFVTFDGAQTVLMRDMPIWLVRSQEVWIQALSKDADGKLQAIAVSGPFLGNRTLMLGKTAPSVVEVFFDGQKILGEATGKFKVDGVLEAHRSLKWNATLHNSDALAVRTQIQFDVGPWPERFVEPVDGLYLFKLPKNVEMTVTGVDFMSVVITMPPQAGGQDGYCGNFNGDVADDFEHVGFSFHRPIGTHLDTIDTSELLFDPAGWVPGAHNSGAQLLQNELDPASVMSDCAEDVRAMAENRCKLVTNVHMREACMLDVCATGLVSAADGVIAFQVLEEKVNSRGIPLLMGQGRCLDAAGQGYNAYTTRRLRKAKDCTKLLRSLSLTGGVMGAQLQEGSTCHILVEDGTDPTEVKIKGGWGPKAGESSLGHGMVSNSTGEAGWTCWQVV